MQRVYFLGFCGRELGMGRRQFHAGEEGRGGNFGNKLRATGSRGVLLGHFSS